LTDVSEEHIASIITLMVEALRAPLKVSHYPPEYMTQHPRTLLTCLKQIIIMIQ
jgi:hypothetical protein